MANLPVLTCERLILRPFQVSDAERVQKLAGTKDVAATTLNIPHPYPDGGAKEWILTHQERFASDEGCPLAICLQDSELLIGAIEIMIDRPHNKGSLGYWLGKEYWNKGYCTEAAREIIKYGFAKLELHKIYATHLANNPASGKVMEKLGMKQEGVLRQHVQKWGKYYDLIYYGILRNET